MILIVDGEMYKVPQSLVHTSQVGDAVGVHLKLVTLQMLADESQQCVQDSHCPRHCGG